MILIQGKLWWLKCITEMFNESISFTLCAPARMRTHTTRDPHSTRKHAIATLRSTRQSRCPLYAISLGKLVSDTWLFLLCPLCCEFNIFFSLIDIVDIHPGNLKCMLYLSGSHTSWKSRRTIKLWWRCILHNSKLLELALHVLDFDSDILLLLLIYFSAVRKDLRFFTSWKMFLSHGNFMNHFH